MRTLKISSLLFLMLATLAACNSTFSAAPSGVQTTQPSAAQERLNLDNQRGQNW